MAIQIENDKGFLIIKASKIEAIAVKDFDGMRCELCDNDCEAGYFIPVINSYYCQTCFDAWYKSATRYKSDIPEETRRFNDLVAAFTDMGCWGVLI